MVFAPAAFASNMAVMEIPPVPMDSTVWPGFKGMLPYRAFHTVVPVQMREASCVHFNAVVLGMRMMEVAGRAIYSLRTPSMGPPRPLSQSFCGPERFVMLSEFC